VVTGADISRLRIDVHAHVWTDEYLDLMSECGREPDDMAAQRDQGAGLGAKELESRFAQMDAAGVDLQVLSVAPLSPHFEREQDAVRVARAANDLYAETVRRWPDRFRALAALPFPHPDAALRELGRALDELGMLGVSMTTSILGRSIADPAFEPVYAELDRRGSALFIHPSGCGALSPLITEHRLTWQLGAPVEDTVAAMQLINAGIPSRYPRLRIGLAHLGGALPLLLGRADNLNPWEAPETPEPPSVAARRLWYDTVSHAYPPALRAAVEAFGADRLMLGSDYPYAQGEAYTAAVSHIGSAGLRAEDAAAIADHNAAAFLFG